MKDYNEEYYLLFSDPDLEEYDIEPDRATAKRNYDSEELDYGQKPLYFTTETDNLSHASGDFEVFFPIGSIVVTDKLRRLLEDGLYGSKFYPAIVQGEEDGTREDVWALNIFKPLDCWDKDKSAASYSGCLKSIDGIDVLPSVKSFYLSSDVLDKIPESNRQLFVMDNTDVTNIFVHKNFVDIFIKNDVKGTKFIKVSDYKIGMEFV